MKKVKYSRYLSLLCLFVALTLVSCGGSKATSKHEGKFLKSNTLVNKVVKTASTYIGSPYRYGGTSRKGFDCSGLVYTVFQQYDFKLPRSSYDMSKVGSRVKVTKAKVGDLIFFTTNPRRKKINHVGIITKIEQGVIYFVHSSTRRGVIVSNMSEPYYKRTFMQINRVM